MITWNVCNCRIKVKIKNLLNLRSKVIFGGMQLSSNLKEIFHQISNVPLNFAFVGKFKSYYYLFGNQAYIIFERPALKSMIPIKQVILISLRMKQKIIQYSYNV
jgi:hypothetical protein